LHIACLTPKVNREIILVLLNAWPDAVKVRDKVWGGLPLHYSCYSTAQGHPLAGGISNQTEQYLALVVKQLLPSLETNRDENWDHNKEMI
jgi:hypothetical protein